MTVRRRSSGLLLRLSSIQLMDASSLSSYGQPYDARMYLKEEPLHVRTIGKFRSFWSSSTEFVVGTFPIDLDHDNCWYTAVFRDHQGQELFRVSSFGIRMFLLFYF
jgi:hypothetical protein